MQFVPFFLRWGAGKAQLDGDVDGVLRQGTFTWRISNDGESSQTGEQVAWLQWSSKMYRELRVTDSIQSVLTALDSWGLDVDKRARDTIEDCNGRRVGGHAPIGSRRHTQVRFTSACTKARWQTRQCNIQRFAGHG